MVEGRTRGKLARNQPWNCPRASEYAFRYQSWPASYGHGVPIFHALYTLTSLSSTSCRLTWVCLAVLVLAVGLGPRVRRSHVVRPHGDLKIPSQAAFSNHKDTAARILAWALKVLPSAPRCVGQGKGLDEGLARNERRLPWTLLVPGSPLDTVNCIFSHSTLRTSCHFIFLDNASHYDWLAGIVSQEQVEGDFGE